MEFKNKTWPTLIMRLHVSSHKEKPFWIHILATKQQSIKIRHCSWYHSYITTLPRNYLFEVLISNMIPAIFNVIFRAYHFNGHGYSFGLIYFCVFIIYKALKVHL